MNFGQLWRKVIEFATKMGVLARDCVLVELILPMSPLLIQFAMKSVWHALRGGGDPTFYKQPLVISAMMLPLVLFIRTTPGLVRGLYIFLLILGTILYTMSVVIDSSVWPESQKFQDLKSCYQFAGLGLIFSGVLRFTSESARVFKI
jgi:hypothetical protein